MKKIHFDMWKKALQVMPRMTNEEFEELDLVSKWLVSTRFAAVVMTMTSAVIAGLLAFRPGPFHVGVWVIMFLGLTFAHATNNIINDLVDFRRGIDKGNYFRALYGPQPLERGMRTDKSQLRYAIINGLIAVAFGVVLVFMRGGLTIPLLLAGIFFMVFYTWPLKYFALGELSLLLVWGPLMVGGGYYVLTGIWDWTVVAASLPYGLGVTATLMGKHIDKLDLDKEAGVHTLPVVIGEKASRVTVIALIVLQYVVTGALVFTGFFTPVMAVVLLALPAFIRDVIPMFRHPRPTEKPADYPEQAWPLWFVHSTFVYARSFGGWFILGLIADTILQKIVL